MSGSRALKRLVDLPEVADLEFKALMTPAYREPEATSQYPEIDECSRALFGLSVAEAEEIQRPDNWDGIERRPVSEQILAFAAEGWDLTDAKRRPLKMFNHFNQQLWLALRGIAGETPFLPEDDGSPEPWAKRLSSEASRFRRR